MGTGTGVRSGLLLALVGLWLIMRATHQDQSGRTLIDHILSKKPGSGQPAASQHTAIASANQGAAAYLIDPSAVVPNVSQDSAIASANQGAAAYLIDPSVVPNVPYRTPSLAFGHSKAQIDDSIRRIAALGGR